MTILINEIKVQKNLLEAWWVVAADRRLSHKEAGSPTKYHDTRKKLYIVPYLNAAVSYFGLAVVAVYGTTASYMSDWLEKFIRDQAGEIKTVEDFAVRLQERLNSRVSSSLLRKMVSGFHICGYNSDGLPVFWFLRNAHSFSLEDGSYSQLDGRYSLLSEEFLARDARLDSMGFDGQDPGTCKEKGWIYRNGDIRIAQAVWFSMDEVIIPWMRNYSGNTDGKFKIPDLNQAEGYAEYVKMKCEVMSYLYKWAGAVNIGRPIDVEILKPPAV